MTQGSGQHLDPTSAPSAESRPQGIVSSRLWRHAFGEMLIETRADGTVLIDGKPVTDTLPPSPTCAPDDQAHADASERGPAPSGADGPRAQPSAEHL